MPQGIRPDVNFAVVGVVRAADDGGSVELSVRGTVRLAADLVTATKVRDGIICEGKLSIVEGWGYFCIFCNQSSN